MLWNVSKLFIIIFSTNAINPFVKLLLPNKSDYLLYASFLVLYNSICWRWKTTRYFDTTISTQMLSFSIIMASRMLQRKQIIFDLAKSTNYLFTRNFFFYLLSIGDGTNGGAGGGGVFLPIFTEIDILSDQFHLKKMRGKKAWNVYILTDETM